MSEENGRRETLGTRRVFPLVTAPSSSVFCVEHTVLRTWTQAYLGETGRKSNVYDSLRKRRCRSMPSKAKD